MRSHERKWGKVENVTYRYWRREQLIKKSKLIGIVNKNGIFNKKQYGIKLKTKHKLTKTN